MSDFSRLPQQDLEEAVKAGYIGIYFEQGVPILDRDLNLLQSMVAENVRSIVRSYIGDGVPAKGSGFEVKAIPADNDFLISKGKCLVDGLEINLAADLKYSDQRPAAGGLSKPASGNRADTVYLDVTLQTVEGGTGGDTALLNPNDVGIQTSVRVKRAWTVRVAENQATAPQAKPGHAHHTLARLTRAASTAKVEQGMIADLRRTRISLDDVERRMSELEEQRLAPALRADREFAPLSGRAGDEVHLFGRNLDLFPIEVRFGDKIAPAVTTIEMNRIVVKVPSAARAGDVPISVTTGTAPNRRQTRSTKMFHVSTEPPAFLPPPEDLKPPSAFEGAPVTLSGENLDIGDFSVRFDSIQVPAIDIVLHEPEKLIVKVPAGLSAPVPVTVKTSAGEANTETKFTVLISPVFVTPAFSVPNVVVGNPLTLNGKHFTGLKTVQFKPRTGPAVPVPSGDSSVLDDGHIRTKAPRGAAGNCKVIVTTAGGEATSPTEVFVNTEV